MRRFVLTLFIILSLVLVIGSPALANDPPDSASVSLKVEIVPPEPAPIPSRSISRFRLYDLTIENITENSADILWATSRSTTSKLLYWSSSELTIEDNEYVKEHLVHLEKLKDNTSYYFKVTCRDRYGLRKSAEGDFATLEKEVVLEPEPEEPEVVEPEEEEPEVIEPEEEEPEVIEPEEEEPEVVEPEVIEPGEEEEEPEVVEIPKRAPWALIGGVVGGLAAIGGIGYWLWRRRRMES